MGSLILMMENSYPPWASLRACRTSPYDCAMSALLDIEISPTPARCCLAKRAARPGFAVVSISASIKYIAYSRLFVLQMDTNENVLSILTSW